MKFPIKQTVADGVTTYWSTLHDSELWQLTVVEDAVNEIGYQQLSGVLDWWQKLDRADMVPHAILEWYGDEQRQAGYECGYETARP